MKRNNFVKKEIICKTIVFLCLMFISKGLFAEPVVIKGVDGTWLPVLAESWIERNNGVVLKPKKNIEPLILRTKLIDRFPDMNIEIINRDLFFPSINIETLFSIIGNIDIDLQQPSEIKSLWADSNVKIIKKEDIKEPLSGDEVISSKVNSLSFDEEDGKMFIEITITERAGSGKFRRYFGKQKIVVLFALKDGVVDQNNSQNKLNGRLLLLKEGSVLNFIPKEYDSSSKAFIISDFYIVRL